MHVYGVLYTCTFYRADVPYMFGKLNEIELFICMRGSHQDRRDPLKCSFSLLSKRFHCKDTLTLVVLNNEAEVV